MTAKDYLKQAYKMDKRIRILQGKAEMLRSVLDYKAPSLDSTGSVASENRMPDTIAKIIEYEEHIQKLQTEYVDKYREIDSAIQSVEDTTLREVLERRYLLYQKWEQIADDMHFTERRVFQLHGKALQKISLNFSIFV